MPLLKHTRWAVLKNAVADHLTAHQLNALGELLAQGFDTATARRVKERLKWIHQVRTPRAARWRITRFINYATRMVVDSQLLEPIRKVLQTLRTHAERISGVGHPPTPMRV